MCFELIHFLIIYVFAGLEYPRLSSSKQNEKNIAQPVADRSFFSFFWQSRIVFFLMNIHNRFRTIYFARVSPPDSTLSIHFIILLGVSVALSTHYFCILQSGQSLIEHSYKADSDLSPAGWEYAEKLKDFVLERRAKSLEQRGLDPSKRKLVVCICEPQEEKERR